MLNYSPQFLRGLLSKGILQLVPSVSPNFFLSSSAHADFLSRPNQHPASVSVPPWHVTIMLFAHGRYRGHKPPAMPQTVNTQKIFVGFYWLLLELLTLKISRTISPNNIPRNWFSFCIKVVPHCVFLVHVAWLELPLYWEWRNELLWMIIMFVWIIHVHFKF